MSSVLKLGLLGLGGRFTTDERFLIYSSGGPLGKKMRIPLKDIVSVSIEEGFLGQSYIKILGNGTELAKTKIPTTWAYKAQDWILDQIKK